MKKILLVALCLEFCGCAIFGHRGVEMSALPPGAPETKLNDDVPFIEQSAGLCGPATLAMVMQWSGQPVSVNAIADQVYTPGMKGSLQSDLISATRRQGLLAIPISGFQALFQELAADHPVIVFENLGLSWLPQWHYAVALGYDRPRNEIILHSGPTAYQREDIHVFANSWKLSNFWGLLVLPPQELAASADEVAHLSAAAGIEQAKNNKEATLAYQTILKKWPQSQGAFMGLGNLAFAKNELELAISYFTKALKSGPDAAAIWHNLAIAQSNAHLKKSARSSAERAIQLAPPQLKAIYQENLKPYLEN